MLTEDILGKVFHIITKEELDAYYNSQFEPMEFDWLDDIRRWIRETYHVNVMTITYKPWWRNTHMFTVYLRHRDEYKDISVLGPNMWVEHSPEIEKLIAMHFEVEPNETIWCRRCAPHQTFEMRAKEYLLLNKAYDFRKEMGALFDHLMPAYFCYGEPVECVLETREEARAFLLSDDYGNIRKHIFDILKPYDDYDVLTPDDIRIFVDYREHKESIPMYGRWISDFGVGEFEKYEISLINED